MDIRAPFVADCEAAEAMEPGDCPFDDPPHDAEAAAVGGAAARDHRDDALRVQPIAMRLGVVAAVALERRRGGAEDARAVRGPRGARRPTDRGA